jgi:hypothetical protein
VKPSKPKPEQKTPGELIAQVSGLISGMPGEFDRAVKALDEIRRRADKAIKYGLLNTSRTEKISAISAEAIAIRGTLTDLWRIVDGIISAGITTPETEIEL